MTNIINFPVDVLQHIILPKRSKFMIFNKFEADVLNIYANIRRHNDDYLWDVEDVIKWVNEQVMTSENAVSESFGNRMCTVKVYARRFYKERRTKEEIANFKVQANELFDYSRWLKGVHKIRMLHKTYLKTHDIDYVM
jgi:hypothetical protein